MNKSEKAQKPGDALKANDRHQLLQLWIGRVLIGLTLITAAVYMQYGRLLVNDQVTLAAKDPTASFLIVKIGSFRAEIQWTDTKE